MSAPRAPGDSHRPPGGPAVPDPCPMYGKRAASRSHPPTRCSPEAVSGRAPRMASPRAAIRWGFAVGAGGGRPSRPLGWRGRGGPSAPAAWPRPRRRRPGRCGAGRAGAHAKPPRLCRRAATSPPGSTVPAWCRCGWRRPMHRGRRVREFAISLAPSDRPSPMPRRHMVVREPRRLRTLKALSRAR